MGRAPMNPSTHMGVPVRLGKLAPRIDTRTLRLARYLKADIPPAPPAVDWGKDATDLGMMANDSLGDCTAAAAAHMIQCWTADCGDQVIKSDEAVIAFYSGSTGYDPADPSTDQGGIELDVLNYWRSTGMDGDKIAAFVALDPKNEEHVKQAVNLFGGCYIGVALPVSAQNQDVWSVAAGGDQGDTTPGSWGGHAVPVVAYDADGITVVTWGALKRMTWDFWREYCDESYAVLSQDDWADGLDGKSPSGFDFAALKADLSGVVG